MNKNTYITLAVIAVLAVAGFMVFNGNDNATNQEQANNSQNADQEAVTVNLLEQNNSGETGTATLTANGDQTVVDVSIAGAPSDIDQPIHIHAGSCENLGGVEYPLASVTGGQSNTVLDVSLDDLMEQLLLAINVHQSPSEISTFVACGNIESTDNSFTVTYTDSGFTPEEIPVPAGSTVTFVNGSSGNMWVASDVHPTHTILPEFDNKEGIAPGETYEFTFNEAGDWTYHNHLAPQNVGTIIVE